MSAGLLAALGVVVVEVPDLPDEGCWVDSQRVALIRSGLDDETREWILDWMVQRACREAVAAGVEPQGRTHHEANGARGGLAFDVAAAAAMASLPPNVIRCAIAAGDLATSSPKVNGKAISKPLIPADELDRWLHNRTA
jgi:hypothetical protein